MAGVRPYHLTPDGERFLMVKAGGRTDDTAPAQTQIVLVQNWFEELTGLAPID